MAAWGCKAILWRGVAERGARSVARSAIQSTLIQPHQQLRRVGLLSVLTISDLNLTGLLVGRPRSAGLADRPRCFAEPAPVPGAGGGDLGVVEAPIFRQGAGLARKRLTA